MQKKLSVPLAVLLVFQVGWSQANSLVNHDQLVQQVVVHRNMRNVVRLEQTGVVGAATQRHQDLQTQMMPPGSEQSSINFKPVELILQQGKHTIRSLLEDTPSSSDKNIGHNLELPDTEPDSVTYTSVYSVQQLVDRISNPVDSVPPIILMPHTITLDDQPPLLLGNLNTIVKGAQLEGRNSKLTVRSSLLCPQRIFFSKLNILICGLLSWDYLRFAYSSQIFVKLA